MPHHVTYQIICFEPAGLGRIEALQNVIRQRFTDLDFDVETAVTFLSYSQVEQCDLRSPTVGVYFGSATTADDATRDRIKNLLASAVTVVPVVDDLTNYQSLVPAELYPINGLQFDAEAPNYETIAARLLEELHLLRETRRLFISYRRSESRDVAIQLYEALDGKGFDVFLDTVSIRPGEDFQKMLHYRLADVDVIVLLHTMGFMERRWTVEELTNANRLNVAILRLEWPEIAAWRKDAEARNDQRELAKITAPRRGSRTIRTVHPDGRTIHGREDPVADGMHYGGRADGRIAGASAGGAADQPDEGIRAAGARRRLRGVTAAGTLFAVAEAGTGGPHCGAGRRRALGADL